MAPMASACPASLAIAVANAGGLGGCGALLMPPDAIHKWVSDVRAGTNGGFQLNLWMPDPPAQARLRRGTPGLAPKPTIIRIRRVLNTAIVACFMAARSWILREAKKPRPFRSALFAPVCA